MTEYSTVAKDEDLTYIVTGLKPTTNYTFEVGTVLYAADQFPTQKSDFNPTDRGETGMFNLSPNQTGVESTPPPTRPRRYLP